MRSLALIAAGIVLVAGAAGCSAQMQPERTLQGSSPSNTLAQGEVVRVDPSQRVIVLSNGQMYQVPADSVVYVNGRPVAWSAVQPGTHVVLQQGQLVQLRDGRYYVVENPTTVVTPAPGTVVTPGPGTTTVVTPPPGATTAPGVRQTLYGQVTDVDRNEVRVRTADNSFEIKMHDPKGAGIRKGDNVQLDMTFTPSSPSALPRR